MKFLILVIISFLSAGTIVARTCDSVSIKNNKLQIEFTDFGVSSKRTLDKSDIRTIHYQKINNKIISINSPDLICSIIENDIEVFDSWLFNKTLM